MKHLLLILALVFSAGLQAASSGKTQSVSILSLSNDANGCFADQTNGASAALLLNGALATSGTCIFASAQQISIEGTGDNDEITYAIVGTGADRKAESETLTGADNGTVKSARFYLSITSITSSGAVDGNIEGGPLSTNGAVSSSIVPDLSCCSPVMSILADVNGTMTLTVDHTSDITPSTTEQTWFSTVAMSAITVDTESNIVAPVNGLRIRITSFTSGDVELTIVQGRK